MSKDSAGQVKRKKFRPAALLLPPAKDFAGPAKRPAAPDGPGRRRERPRFKPEKACASVCAKARAASGVHIRA